MEYRSGEHKEMQLETIESGLIYNVMKKCLLLQSIADFFRQKLLWHLNATLASRRKNVR